MPAAATKAPRPASAERRRASAAAEKSVRAKSAGATATARTGSSVKPQTRPAAKASSRKPSAAKASAGKLQEPVAVKGGIPLSPEQAERLGAELDALRTAVRAELGERDARYIRRVIAVQRSSELAGRLLLFAGIFPPAWIAGTSALALSKILDNMEIGHNVMHGQYDWMNDPRLNGKSYEWDTACPGDQWRHSHNYIHHTFTNIVGKDRDVGYGLLRMSEDQRWRPYYLGNPVYATLLAMLFQYGVAVHDLEFERIVAGKTSFADTRETAAAVWRKTRKQWLKDYVLFPVLAGPAAPFVFTGNMTANLARNLWAFTIIFCGHFPSGAQEFSESAVVNESRGEWYVRQALGSANLTGGPIFHILSGNLSHQIEHHLFPELPAHRYAELSGPVQEIMERYGLQYNAGPLHSQFASVLGKIARLALPPEQSLPAPVRSVAKGARKAAKSVSGPAAGLQGLSRKLLAPAQTGTRLAAAPVTATLKLTRSLPGLVG